MSAKRNICLSDQVRSPSPGYEPPLQRRFRVDDSPPVGSIRARLGGFVNDSPSLDKRNDANRDRRSFAEVKREPIRYSPEKYGPRPPSTFALSSTANHVRSPSYSNVVAQHTTKVVVEQRPQTVFKRSVITGPDASDSSDSSRRLTVDGHERTNASHNRNNSFDSIGRTSNRSSSNAQNVARVSESAFIRSSEKESAVVKSEFVIKRENRNYAGDSPRYSDGIRLERTLHGIDTVTPLTSGLIDTHMHIDFTLKAFRQSAETTWTDFCKRHSGRFPDCFEGAIAIFCQPDSFKCSSEMLNEAFQSDKLWMAFGVHPHFSDQYSEDSLRACLHKFKSKVVALGEIGLDTSGKNHVRLEVQKEVFRSQAEIGMECNLPLVIHARVGDGNAETFAFMRQFIPREYRIHRHCFTGKWEEANEWMSHFRNCYIGFTPLINSQHDVMEVACRVPLNRILLETDAPYFKTGLPPLENGGRAIATVSGDVIYTAAGIAKAKGLPIEAVICQTRLNAKTVYGI